MFVFISDNTQLILLAYIDDIIITGNNDNLIDLLVKDLHSEFALKDLGQLKFFLGIVVTPTASQLHLTQTKHVNEVLQKVELSDSKACATPMITLQYYLPLTGLHYRIQQNIEV